MYRIRELREDRDLTQAQIAKVLHTTQQQYSKIETGKADISGEKLILLAQFYKVLSCFFRAGRGMGDRRLRHADPDSRAFLRASFRPDGSL